MSIKRLGLYLIVAFLVACIGLVGFVSPAYAALIFHSGFEISDFSEWSSIVGSPAVVETQKKTGSYAMQCDTTGGAAVAYATAPQAYDRVSVYIRIATAPNTDTRILVAQGFACYLTTNRETDVYDNDGKKADGSTQIPLNTWTRISAAYHITNEEASVWIDGNLEHNAVSLTNPGAYSDTCGLGVSCTADIYFDDFAGDDTVDTVADIGDIRVARASPNLAGTYAQYDSVSGFGNVDEIPTNDADFIEDNGADAARESYNIPNLADLNGASSGDTVNAVSIWIRGDSDGGGATDHKAMVRDNGSDYKSSDLAFNGIAWFNWYLAVMPDDSAAWIEARLNSLEIGAYHLGGQDQRVHCLVAMVAYTPAAVGEADISNTPASKAFGVVSSSTTYWANGSEPTWPLVDGDAYFTVTNNGDTCSITIVATDFTGGVGWTLGTPAENTVRLTAFKEGDGSGDGKVLTTSPQAFISGLTTNIDWEIKMETPTSMTDGAEKTSTLTLTATLD